MLICVPVFKIEKGVMRFRLDWNSFLDDLLNLIAWTLVAVAASACAISLCIGSDYNQRCSTFDIWATMATVSSGFLVFQLFTLFFYHLASKWVVVVQQDCETDTISV